MDNANWYESLIIWALIAVIFLTIFVLLFHWDKRIKSKVFEKIKDFKVDASHLGGYLGDSVAIDNERRKFCFVKSNMSAIFDFKDVLKCEVINQSYLASKSGDRKFTFTTRVNGEIGTMNIPGDTLKMCDSLGLIITMNNADKTPYKLLFITEPTPENSVIYYKAYELFNAWRKLFEHHALEKDKTDSITHSETIINIKADPSATPQVAQLVSSILAQTQTPSVADEILKLKNLLDQGALTQEEFEAQKAKVLNG